MRRRLLLVLLSLGGLLTAGLTVPASADIAFTQQVVLRQDKGPFTMRYRSFPDGYGSCEDCPGPYRTGGGKMKVHLRSYKLQEQAPKDYYLVDVTITTRDRYGSERYGYVDAKVQSTRAVDYATYSLGKKDVAEDCDTYDINIAGGFHGISAGTTVTSFSTCTESPITHKPATYGRNYHVTNFNGVRKVSFQRFVRVGKGKTPVFRIAVTRPTDECKVYTWSDGQHYYCYNKQETKVWKIGTARL
jgi:hypothetical protein